MNKEKLVKFIYVLLRERLTFGDMEAILNEVENSNTAEQMPLVQLYAEEIVNRLLKSELKCYDNMCNTQDDDVKLISASSVACWELKNNVDLVRNGIPMCADCRKRYPQAVLTEN